MASREREFAKVETSQAGRDRPGGSLARPDALAEARRRRELAFYRLVAQTPRDIDTARLAAAEAMLSGIGAAKAGNGLFADGGHVVDVVVLDRDGDAPVRFRLDMRDSASAAILARGDYVFVQDRAAELNSGDGLIARLNATGFHAEPIRDAHGVARGFVFVALDQAGQSSSLDWQEFASSVAAWLLRRSGQLPAAATGNVARGAASLELLEDTFQHMEQGLVVFDDDLRILALNDQVGAMLQIPDNILKVGGSMRDVIGFAARRGDYGPDLPQQYERRLLAMLRRGKPYDVIRRSGAGRAISCFGRPRRNGGYIVTFTDITALTDRERELSDMSRTLAITLDHVEQGLLVCDRNSRILAANRRLRELFGLHEDEVKVGAPVSAVFTCEPIANSTTRQPDVGAAMHRAARVEPS